MEHAKSIPKHKKREAAWLRMEAARAMCDLADGFMVAGSGSHKECVNLALAICADSADAYWLANSRLAQLGFPLATTIKFSEKAHELVDTVDTAYEVGMTCFKLKRYGDAVEWLKKAEKHGPTRQGCEVCVGAGRKPPVAVAVLCGHGSSGPDMPVAWPSRPR